MERKEFSEMVKGAGELPVCATPEQVQSVISGMHYSIDLVASDPEGLITGIQGAKMPHWAALDIVTELPSPDAVARVSGTPGREDQGLHVMWVIVTNNKGKQAASPLKLKVDNYFHDDYPGVF